MREKTKLIKLKICRIILAAVMSVLQTIEQPETIDKSVLDEEIPLDTKN